MTQYYLPSEKRSIYNSIFDTEELLLTNVKGIYSNYSGNPQLIVTDFIVSDESYVALDMKAIADTKTVTEVFELTTNGKYGSNITWSVQSGEEYITIENNIVTSVIRPGSDAENDAKVVLLATFELNEVKNITKTVTITVTKMPGENEPEQPAEPVTVTLTYTAATTTNMTGNNDASLVGLDSEIFNVIGKKGSCNKNIGLNKSGYLALYSNRNDGDGNILRIEIDEVYLIQKIVISFGKGSNGTATFTVNGITYEKTTTEYIVNDSFFEIINTFSGGSTNAQLWINSIEITYVEK